MPSSTGCSPLFRRRADRFFNVSRVTRVSEFSRPIPTGWFALLVALSAIPVMGLRPTSWLILAAVGVLIIVLAAVDAALAVRPRDIEVVREFSATLTVGEPGEIAWRVRSHATRSTSVTVADAIWPSLQASRRRASFVLGSRQQHRFGAHIEPRRRGRFPFGAVTVRTVGPMRLVALHTNRTVDGTIAVMPAYPSR